MNIPKRFQYFFSIPPLWIIQIGRDELIFSQITKNDSYISNQERLYLEPYTTLPNKIANPSSLSKGLLLFCKQKKLSRLRGWFLLPKDCFPQPLLAHELFQFLISIKKTPIIPEIIGINPFDKPINLSPAELQAITSSTNSLFMFERYNKLHPAWWALSTVILFSITMLIFSQLYKQKTSSTPLTQQKKIIQAKKNLAMSQQSKKSTTPQHMPPSSIAESLATLTNIATIIPPSIVLNKLSEETIQGKNFLSRITTITGTTCNLSDLLEFVTQLEQATLKICTLSYIKELALKNLPINSTHITFYSFSLSIQ